MRFTFTFSGSVKEHDLEETKEMLEIVSHHVHNMAIDETLTLKRIA